MVQELKGLDLTRAHFALFWKRLNELDVYLDNKVNTVVVKNWEAIAQYLKQNNVKVEILD